MQVDYFTYTLAEHWVCALEYGDADNLSKTEERQLSDFLESLPGDAIGWEYGEAPRFAVDEISGLHAQCVDCKLFFPKR